MSARLSRLVLTLGLVLGMSAAVRGQTPAAASATDLTALTALIADGRRLFDERQIEAATAAFLDALRRAEQQDLPGPQAQALLGLGRIHADRDHRAEARHTFERSLTLFTRAGDRTGHALALVASGLNLSALGETTEATRRVKEACDTLRTTGADADSLARGLSAQLALMPSGPDKDRIRDEGLVSARAATDRSYECAILHSWGSDLFRGGDFAGAYRRVKEAAACYEPLPKQGRLGSVLVLLGDIERAHGQFETALTQYRRALEVQQRRDDPIGTASGLSAVGVGLGALWRLDEAGASFEAALALARETRAETFTPYLVGQLGQHLAQSGRYREALPLLKESLNQAQGRRSQVDRLIQLGTVYAQLGDVRAAIEHGDRAVTLARPEGPALLMHALRSRAEARRLSGDLDGAAADLREGIDTIEGVRRQTVPIDFMKRGFSEWHQWLFGSSIALSTQKRDVREALETAERARARAFLDLLATREQTARGSDPTDPSGVSADLSATLTTPAAPAAPAPATPATPAPAAAPLAPRTSPITRLAGMSTGAPADTPSLDSSLAVPAATVRSMIATARRLHSTLLVYWVEVDATFIWVITPDGRVYDKRVEIPLGRIASLVSATRPPAGADAAAMLTLASASQRRPWRDLHDRLIKPVRAHLPASPGALLTIVPHGPLFQLSFAALQDERGRYLVERYRLHYTPAVGVLSFTDRRKRGRDARRYDNALLVGDPGELPGGTDEPPLAALPWARREVAEVATLLRTPPNANASPRNQTAAEPTPAVLVDTQASESEVRARLGGRTLLHFATHGIVRQNESMSSYLALRADANASVDANADADRHVTDAAADGRLTANEVYSLQIDADLVILSACSSALGPMTGDGVIGFTRAFLSAGASSVIATAWEVPDAASYTLMRRFYQARRDTSPAGLSAPITSRALRSAQLATLAALRRGQLTVPTSAGDVALPEHPLLWAGFLLVGEP